MDATLLILSQAAPSLPTNVSEWTLLTFLGVAGLFGLWGAYRIVIWFGINVAKPIVDSVVRYLQSQITATEKIQSELTSMGLLESDIRKAIEDMAAAHNDSESTFATVHTNVSIKILARAIGRVAKAVNANVEDLIDQIEHELRHRDPQGS